jgi:hypothetical protein
VAEELALDWHTVKALDMQYMQAQLKRAAWSSRAVARQLLLLVKVFVPSGARS